MHSFTESHLRRVIDGAKGRLMAIHLVSGATVRGVVHGVDTEQDGFVELVLDTENDRVRFVTPIENIVAYEVTEPE